MILNDALISSTKTLQASSDSPALDAQVLLAHVLNESRTYLIAHAKDSINKNKHEEFEALVLKRLHGTPVAYLTGTQEFWSLPLKVNSDTLIPRPETELLVELALEKISLNKKTEVADIGTGSGAVALAIASERQHCRILATDLSAAALDIAKENSLVLKLSNISFEQGESLQPLNDRKFNLIVSNPPYVAETDPHLQQGDVRFEPQSALVAGREGLDIIQLLINGGADFLEDEGWLMIEHGYDQEQAIELLFNEAGYKNVECYRDLAEQPRVSIGQK